MSEFANLWNSDRVDRLIQFEKELLVHAGIDDFHEWAVLLATKKFKEKRTNSEPVASFAFQRPEHVIVMNCKWEDEREKDAVFATVRHMLEIDQSIPFMAHLQEIYLTVSKTHEEMAESRKRYGAVRNMPDRVDGLMVHSYARDGGAKLTKWEVKLKPNPDNNIMLARDDVDMRGMQFRGRATGFFSPVTEADDE